MHADEFRSLKGAIDDTLEAARLLALELQRHMPPDHAEIEIVVVDITLAQDYLRRIEIPF